jgi:hypothetical protein
MSYYRTIVLIWQGRGRRKVGWGEEKKITTTLILGAGVHEVHDPQSTLKNRAGGGQEERGRAKGDTEAGRQGGGWES